MAIYEWDMIFGWICCNMNCDMEGGGGHVCAL